ncbi:hypothetical protein ACWEFJ_06120 [Actinosynnema sp. NPDC004786]
MTDDSYLTTLTVDRTPAEVYAAVLDVRGWRSEEVEGEADRLGAEFAYRNTSLRDLITKGAGWPNCGDRAHVPARTSG